MHVDREEKPLTRRPSPPRGYALMLVMVFVVLFTAMLGVAWRRIASALRVENVTEVRRQSDEGSIPILAQAMKVLETRLRWDATTSTYKLDGSTDTEISYSKSIGGKNYKITFTRNGAMDGTEWSVSVAVLTAEEYAALSVGELPSAPP